MGTSASKKNITRFKDFVKIIRKIINLETGSWPIGSHERFKKGKIFPELLGSVGGVKLRLSKWKQCGKPKFIRKISKFFAGKTTNG